MKYDSKCAPIRIERQPRTSGGPRIVFVYKCAIFDCKNEVKIRSGLNNFENHSGKCKAHAQRKRPFESIYNGLFKDHRHTKIDLTYEEFIEFTKINNCHYCGNIINRHEYGTVDNKFISRAYYLDRKDNAKSYSKNNCVVCCTRCNKSRSNYFNYEEWFNMTKYLRDRVKHTDEIFIEAGDFCSITKGESCGS